MSYKVPLQVYVRSPQPALAESQEKYLQTELRKIEQSFSTITEALNAVDEGTVDINNIESVNALPATGAFIGQVQYLISNNTFYRWTGTVWSDDVISVFDPSLDLTGQIDLADFVAGLEAVGVVNTLPDPSGYTGAKIVFNIADGKLYRYVSGAWTTAIFASDIQGTFGASNFALNLRPVEIVDSLPTTGNFVGRVVLNYTDGKLYRYLSTGWTAAVNSSDITGLVSNAQIEGLAASKITGQLTNAQLADIAAAKISGQLTNAQIADIAAAKVSGQLTNAQIASIDATKLFGTIASTQIADNAITTPKIAANSITTSQLAANSITADKILASAITSDKIEAGAITTAKIAAGAVTAGTIATNAITAEKVSAGAITSDKIAARAVTADTIASNAITAVKIEAGAVTTAKLAAGAVVASTIAAGSITGDRIAANAITSDNIDANAITSGKIAAGAIVADKLGVNSVTAGVISAAAVNSTAIAASAITTDKLNARAITTDKIALNAITADLVTTGTLLTTSAQISDGIITNAKIGDAQITAAKIGDAQITTAKIGTAQIDTLRIAGNAVTIPVAAYSDGDVYVGFGMNDAPLAQRVTMVSSGAPKLINFCASTTFQEDYWNGGAAGYTAYLYRNGVYINESSCRAGATLILSFVDYAGAGTYTYDIRLFTYPSAGNVSKRTLSVLEVKR